MSQSMYSLPLDPYFMPPGDFEAFIGNSGQRVSWMRSHSCPCVWTQAFAGVPQLAVSGVLQFNPDGSPIFASGSLAAQGRLATPGSAQSQCRTCSGVGIYWDAPSEPIQVAMSFRHISPSPDEPGVVMNTHFGVTQLSEPAMTIPFKNPFLAPGDPRQPTAAWYDASIYDMFCAVDMTARYNAMLQVSGQVNLPFQQNLTVSPSGAVSVWNPVTQSVVPVSGYTVAGPTVTIAGYPAGTSYLVEFSAAALYVAFRRAGGLPHVRPLAGGTITLPKAFRLQSLDFWTRERNIQPVVNVGGQVLALSIR